MTTAQAVASILVMAGVTFLTRVIPFALFGRAGSPPGWWPIWGRCCPRR